MKKRENWADLCKLTGIFFMVWGHAGVSTEMDIYLHSFHMPIFFFLSGYWFSPGKYGMKEFLKRRAKSLLGSYLFYGAALCVLWNVYSLIAAPDQFVPWEKIAESLFLFNADFSPFAAVQWFLTALFLSEMIFFLFLRLLPKRKWIPAVIALALSLLGWFWPVWGLGRLPLALDCAFTGTAFYALGYLAKCCLKKPLAQFSGTIAALPASAILLALGVWLAQRNGYTNMRVLLYGNYFLYYLCALCTICGMALFCMWVEKAGLLENPVGNFLLYFGKNTLMVLVMNQAVRQVLENITHLAEWIAPFAPMEILWIRAAEAVLVLLLCGAIAAGRGRLRGLRTAIR